MRNSRKYIIVICVIFSSAWFICCSQKAEEISLQDPAIKDVLAEICTRDLHSHIGFLASDELQGRGTPSIYLDIAARYIGAELEKYALVPGGEEDSYLQPYTINVYPYEKEKFKVSFSSKDKLSILSGEKVIPLLFAGAGVSVEIKGPIVFAGYGITAPEKNWDDYQDLDVQGKVVLVMEGAPWEVDLDVPFGYDKLLGKWLNASQRGAIGFIYATPLFGEKMPLSVSFAASPTMKSVLLRKSLHPQIQLCSPGIVTSFEVADDTIMPAKRGDLNSLRDLINKDEKPICFHVEQSQFSLKLETEPKETKAFNVIGILKGSDPKLAEEYIAITAHYDHVGVGRPVNGDSIYNGADDNASGTAGVLELAQAFSSLPEEVLLRRSILFILISGEEVGLYGSAHYAENPTIPMSQVKANINLDMIGRCPEGGVEVIAPVSEELAEMMIKSSQAMELKTQPEQHPEMRLLYLSDHFPFVYNNIPAVFCFTGIHPDYHQPSDHIEKLNFADMEKIVKAVFITTLKLANEHKVPEFKPPAYFFQQ